MSAPPIDPARPAGFFTFGSDHSSYLTTPMTADLYFPIGAMLYADVAIDTWNIGTQYLASTRIGSPQSGVFLYLSSQNVRLSWTDKTETGLLVSQTAYFGAGARHTVLNSYNQQAPDGENNATWADGSLTTTDPGTQKPGPSPTPTATEFIVGGREDNYYGIIGDVYHVIAATEDGTQVLEMNADDAGLPAGPVADGTTFESGGRVWTVVGDDISYSPPPLIDRPRSDGFFTFADGVESTLATPMTADLHFPNGVAMYADIAPSTWSDNSVIASTRTNSGGGRGLNFTVASGDNILLFWHDNAGDTRVCEQIASPPDGERHTLCHKYDPLAEAGLNIEAWLDGVAVAATGTPSPGEVPGYVTDVETFTVGGREYGTYPFAGDVHYVVASNPDGTIVASMNADDAGLPAGPVADGTTFESGGRVWTVRGTGVSYTPPPSFFTLTDNTEDCISTPYTPDLNIEDDIWLGADVALAHWDANNFVVSNGDTAANGHSVEIWPKNILLKQYFTATSTMNFRGDDIAAGRHTIGIEAHSAVNRFVAYLDGDEYAPVIPSGSVFVGNQGDDFKIGYPDHGAQIGMEGAVYSAYVAAGEVVVALMDANDAGLPSGPVADGTTFTSNGRVWTVHGTGVSYTNKATSPSGAASRLSVLRNRDKIKTLTPGSVRLER